jgi:transcriptional regulator with XRE-family HTH domain
VDAQEDLSVLKLALRSWCERRGRSQSALSMKLGISVSHLNAILSGRAQPGAALIQKIYAFLAAHQKPTPLVVELPLERPLRSAGDAGDHHVGGRDDQGPGPV